MYEDYKEILNRIDLIASLKEKSIIDLVCEGDEMILHLADELLRTKDGD